MNSRNITPFCVAAILSLITVAGILGCSARSQSAVSPAAAAGHSPAAVASGTLTPDRKAMMDRSIALQDDGMRHLVERLKARSAH